MPLIFQAKQWGKRLIARGLHASGVLPLLRRRAMRGRALVLVYHRVVSSPSDLMDYAPSGMTVSSASFAEQMAFVAEHYHVVPLHELMDRLSGPASPGALCAVTFDDGWLDNYTTAWPVLRSLGMPATIFVTPGFIEGSAWFWEERLKYLLAHYHQRHQSAPQPDRQVVMDLLQALSLSGLLDLHPWRFRRALTALVNSLRNRADEERREVMRRLEEPLSRSAFAEPARFMSWDQLRELCSAGIDAGAHTLTHVNLARCDDATASHEIGGSREVLEHATGQPVTLFAYPYGKHTAQVRWQVALAGFRWAFTNRSGLVGPADDPMSISRIDIRDTVAPTVPYFACRAMQLAGLY